MTGPVGGPAPASAVPAFGTAAKVTAAGLAVLVVAIPFATVRVDSRLLGTTGQGPTLNSDDLVMGCVIAGVAAVVAVAGLLRRPWIMSVALIPLGVFVLWVLLVGVDIQFETSLLADEITTRLNRERSVAVGGFLDLAGLLVVCAGLAMPLLDRRNV